MIEDSNIARAEDLETLKIDAPTMIDNRYIIEKELGRGGIGVVFKAKDTETNQYVVIKMLHDVLASDEWIVGKFTKEAKAIVEKLKDVEGVVKGVEQGILPNKSPYLVMEYVEGNDLKVLVKKNATGIDLERSANILKQLGKTITKIHQAGIYHRDLKPENIMLTLKDGEEKIKVIDFGIATVKESPNEKTSATVMAGTPAYMAPEQIMGKPTNKSDIYAMGIIAYEMITGRIPFNIAGFPLVIAPVKLYEMQEKGILVSPKQLRPDLSDEADRLIIKALSFKMEDRFASAQEFGELLSKALLDEEMDVLTRIETKNRQTKAYDFAKDSKDSIGIKADNDILPSSVPHNFNRMNLFIGVIIAVLTIVIVSKFGFHSRTSNISSTPTNTTSVAITNKLDFNIELEEFRDGKYQTPTVIAGERLIFHNNDRIRFNLTTQKNGYIYLLNESPKPLSDDIPKYFLLFPNGKEENFFPANQEITIPKKKDIGLEFSGSLGTEKIWIIWSSQQILELETVKQSVDNKKVLNPIEKLEQAQVIKTLLAKYKVNKFEENKTTKKLEVSTSESNIVVLLELEHR